jgi:hypothetical protein
METEMKKIYWTSEDGQSSLDMGSVSDYSSISKEGIAAEALAELVGQCTDDEQVAGILAGNIAIVEE